MSEPDASPSGATAAIASSGPTAPDRLFAGRYRLTGRRGSGLDIALFEGVDVLSDRTVAVKIVHPDICARPGFDDQFSDMIHRVAALRHTNVAQILDVGSATWGGQHVRYVVCENLTGGSLRDLRDRGRQLTPSQVIVVGLDVCRGLDVAHRAGLVHGDIRPANLVFGEDGRLRITDLGLVEMVSEGIWDNPAAVSADRARYASPEQAANRTTGPQSDVYSLCLCLLEGVTGQLPFVGDSTVATLANRVDRLMPVSADLGPLASVFERAGRPDPNDRYTAAEFGRALVQAAERLPRPAPIALLSTGLFTDPPLTAPVSDPGFGVNGANGANGATSSLPPPPPPGHAATAPPLDPLPPIPPIPPMVSEPVASGRAHEPAVVALFDEPLDDADDWADDIDDGRPSEPLLRHSTARRKLLSVLAIVIVAATVGGALAWFVGRDQSNAVPDLVGVQRGAALNMVSEFGWLITTTEESSDDIPAGAVLRTDPASGASLEEGDEFLIVVSTGPAPRTLPELTGLTVDEARTALTELGLVLELGDELNDDVVPIGTIISWTVPEQPGLAAGDTVTPNTTVRVVVSSGPAPRVLPELGGLVLADAIEELEGMSLVAVQGTDEFSDTVPIGAVVRQDPPAGTSVPINSSVTIIISKGSEFVTVPPLANLTLPQAVEALTLAGLQLGEVTGDTGGINTLAEVDGVSIGAAAVFPRGTFIDLTFGSPAPPSTEAPETTVAPA
jgi:eukaryotic-like serine/threonine-protein kinase